LYLVLFGGVWRLTGSYTLLRLVVPLAAGATVLLTYAFGARYFNARVALLAAVLLALFPIYRENGPLAFVEPLSALLILSALWAFVARRTALTVVLGSLAVLGKIDMIVLYFGTIVFATLASARVPGERMPIRHVAACLAGPLVVLLPWLYLTYVLNARPTTVAGGPQLGILLTLAPLMFEQLFTIQPIVAVSLIGLLAGAAGWSLWLRKGARPIVYSLLASWLALGCVVVAVYSSMPGASNNPRVLIPALPAFCLLVADGISWMRARLGRLTICYLLALFVLIDGVGIWYQVLQARAAAANMPVWEALRAQPRGFVLTDDFWNAALYARQPVTWFDMDTSFQSNILQNLDHFRKYLADTPIRYIVLPRDERAIPAYMLSPDAQLYDRLPFGRELGWTMPQPVAPEVRAFLEQHYPKQSISDADIFVLERQ
jgi:4-amino-4-deoxy-L-arabinose transferase-like glycosyltransferase